MPEDKPIPRIPKFPALPLRVLPKAPPQAVLRFLADRIAARRPNIFTRLGAHAEKRFLIAPSDLPLSFLIRPACAGRRITVMNPDWPVERDCRIAGPFAALLGLMHGYYDGDGLFFSRDLTVEGDVEAVLALRNALDDAELDLFTEMLAGLGGPGRLADRTLRPPLRAAARATGLALVRIEESR